jgi:hypothetical protein
MKPQQQQIVERLAYTVNQTLATGAFPNRNKLYDALARGDLETWKDGRTRMISGGKAKGRRPRGARPGSQEQAKPPSKAESDEKTAGETRLRRPG